MRRAILCVLAFAALISQAATRVASVTMLQPLLSRYPQLEHAAFGAELPDNAQPFVLLKLATSGNDGNIFRERRRDQHSVKGVVMMSGQSEQS